MSSRVRPTPPHGLSNSKRSVPSRASQNASSSTDHAGFKRQGYQSESKAQEDYFLAVGIKIDEATEPGVSDEDASRHHTLIKKLLRGNTVDGVPPKPESVSAGAAVSQGLRKRLKSSDDVAVLNTLVFIDELMRTIPLFYNFISNEKFFRQLWRLVVPDYKEQSIQIPFLTRSKNLRTPRVVDPKIQERVLILIRAWAETLSEMRMGFYDPRAKFYIERYEAKRNRVTFPEVPQTDTPWVCPLPKSLARNRRSSVLRDGSSGRSGLNGNEEAMTIDEIENSVNLFSSLVDNATSSSDLKSELCSELAEKCELISRSMEKISAGLNSDKDLVRAINITDSLQSTLKRYKEGLAREDWEKDDIGHIATVSLDSEDDESYNDVHKRNMDGPLPKFRSMRIRSAETHGAGPSSARHYGGRENDNDDNRDLVRSNFSYGRAYDVLNEYRTKDVDQSPAPRRTPRSRHNPSNEYYYDNDRDSGDYPGPSRTRVGGRESHGSSRDHRVMRHERKGDSKSGSDVDVGESDLKPVRERGHVPGKERERTRPTAPARTSKVKEADKKSKGVAVRRNESNVTGARPEKAKKGSKKKHAESSTGDDDPRAYEDESESSSDDLSDPPNEESFKLLAERFKSQKQSRNIKKASTKNPSKKSAVSRRNAPTVTVEEMGQDSSSNGARAFSQSPMMFNGNGMYPSGMPMGMNPMMMMGAPMANPFGMYGSVNPMFMPDPMGMFNPYSTVNPAMYYQSMNPNFMTGMAPPMNGPGYGESAMGVGNRGFGAGSPEGAGQRVGGPSNHPSISNDSGVGQDTQAGRRALAYPNYDPGSSTKGPASSTLANNSSETSHPEAPNSISPGWSSEVAVHPGLSSQTFPPPVPFSSGIVGGETSGPRNSGELSKLNEGPSVPFVAGGVGGFSPQHAERQAAMYQSAMQQAATAYHMAATAYKTMQGQAAISTDESNVVRNGNTSPPASEGAKTHPSIPKEEED